jgi:hypothetical protein
MYHPGRGFPVILDPFPDRSPQHFVQGKGGGLRGGLPQGSRRYTFDPPLKNVWFDGRVRALIGCEAMRRKLFAINSVPGRLR